MKYATTTLVVMALMAMPASAMSAPEAIDDDQDLGYVIKGETAPCSHAGMIQALDSDCDIDGRIGINPGSVTDLEKECNILGGCTGLQASSSGKQWCSVGSGDLCYNWKVWGSAWAVVGGADVTLVASGNVLAGTDKCFFDGITSSSCNVDVRGVDDIWPAVNGQPCAKGTLEALFHLGEPVVNKVTKTC